MISQIGLGIKNKETEEKKNMIKSDEFSKERLICELEKYIYTRKMVQFNALMQLSPDEDDYKEMESAYCGSLAELDCLCEQFGFLY